VVRAGVSVRVVCRAVRMMCCPVRMVAQPAVRAVNGRPVLPMSPQRVTGTSRRTMLR
jgi:hypothetical protein